MKKRWVKYPESDNELTCPVCDDCIEVETVLPDEDINAGLYEDSARVRCLDGCEYSMQIDIIDGIAEVNFY